MRINQNVLAIRTHGQIAATNDRTDKSIEKLSSGLRINRAADDAAGLAISEKLRRQVRGLSRAVLNAQDGISMIQAAEGSLNESHSILQRMRELAIQASNDTLTSNDRLEIQKEVVQLRDDLNRIARNTEFNTKKLLDGSQTALISASSNSVRGFVTGAGAAGGDVNISLALITGGIAQMNRSQIFTVKGQESNLALGTTQLQSIAQFYDANGVFQLQSPQQLTLIGNSRTTTITLDGQMTLDKLAGAIQNALTTTSGLDLVNSKVAIVNTAVTQVSGLGGYLQIVSGTVGEDGKIAFAGDQGLLNALGITETRAAKNNMVEATLRDGNGNMRQVRTDNSRIVGLLDGIDLEFTSQAAQVAGTQGLEQGLLLTAGGGVQTFNINAGGIATVQVQVGSGFWTMEGIARSINQQVLTQITTAVYSAAAQSLRDGLKAMVVDGQIRIGWEAPSNISSANGTLKITGATAATTIGLLNGTYSGFVQGTRNVDKIEWGFSQYNNSAQTGISSGSTLRFLINDGQVVTGIRVMNVVSAATIADGVMFKTWQASTNQLLAASSVAVRVDQIGGAFAFTSLRVGRENPDNAAGIDSQVMVTFSASDMADAAYLNIKFGIEEQTAMGSGDKNFRVHVVSNTPQFQIGADQGQIMNVAFADMTARALGVDNLDLTTIAGSSMALAKLNQAIDRVSSERSKLGAFQNRLEYAINNLRNIHQNLSTAESRLRDVDVAQEMIEFTRDQIIGQSGMAMLAQANTIPQSVLQLLK